jgi:hypothetical protein
VGLSGSMLHFWCPVPVQVRTNTQTCRETYRESQRPQEPLNLKIQNLLDYYTPNPALQTPTTTSKPQTPHAAQVQGITEDEWRVTEATRDLSANNISHKFWSTKKAKGLQEVTRMFSCLLPGEKIQFDLVRFGRQT